MSNPITYIDNCPVKFSSTSPDEPAACDFDQRVLCQLAQQSDYLAFSFFGSECGSEECACPTLAESCIAANFGGLFGWQYYNNSFGQYFYHSALQSPLFYTTALTGLYKVTVTIGVGTSNEDTGFSTGTTLQGSLTITTGTYNSGTYTWTDTDNVYTTPGTKTFYVTYNGTYLGFQPTSTFNGTISAISLIKINTDYLYTITDLDNVPQYISPVNEFSQKKNWFRLRRQWSDFSLPAGCYKVAVIDMCTIGSTVTNKVTNGSFTGSSAGWTLGAGWAYGSNKITHTAGSANSASQAVTLTAGKTYIFRFTVSDRTAGSLNVLYGVYPLHASSATGTFVYYYTPSSSSTLYFTPSTDFDGSVDDVYVFGVEEYLTANPIMSNCFSLNTTHSCTKSITFYCEDDAFGVPYSYLSSVGDYAQTLRIECEQRNPSYPEEQTSFRNSAGTNEKVYFKREKIWELRIAQQPEYVHDAISVIKGSDVVYIDGVEYVCTDDEYTPEWSKQPTLRYAPSSLMIQKKTDNQVNKKC